MHPGVEQLITTDAWFVKSPPSGVIVGILALMTMGESMLVTSLADSEGEVARHLTTEPVLVTEMVDVRSVGEVIEALQDELGSSTGGAAKPVLPAAEASVEAPNVPVAATDGNNNEAAIDAVLTVLADKTGYEKDMLDLDMELETELGVDSIKRVEILSEVQDLLSIEAKDTARL